MIPLICPLCKADLEFVGQLFQCRGCGVKFLEESHKLNIPTENKSLLTTLKVVPHGYATYGQPYYSGATYSSESFTSNPVCSQCGEPIEGSPELGYWRHIWEHSGIEYRHQAKP